MNPPLRSAEDRDALRAGLADGTIDAVATDHAPHAVEEKEVEFDLAPPGTIGLETALGGGADLAGASRASCPLSRAIDALSTTPARILGATDHGGPIEPGRPANLVVFDPVRGLDRRATVRLEGPQQRLPRRTAARARAVHDLGGALIVAEGKPTR